MKEHDMMIVTINLIYFIYQLVVSIKVLLDIKLIDLRYWTLLAKYLFYWYVLVFMQLGWWLAKYKQTENDNSKWTTIVENDNNNTL